MTHAIVREPRTFGPRWSRASRRSAQRSQRLPADVRRVGSSDLRLALAWSALKRLDPAHTPYPASGTPYPYFITQGYCIEIVVRKLVQSRLPLSPPSNAGIIRASATIWGLNP